MMAAQPPHPLQNRVLPDGTLVALAARGLFMGNRGGRFHDPRTGRLRTRRAVTRRWICCRLAFHGRRRSVWGWGYTELFFCDEVTALAAGHRPCFECRRDDARRFAAAVAAGLGLAAPPSADALDRRLERERRERSAGTCPRLPFADLPAGAIWRDAAGFFARQAPDRCLRWGPAGYRPAEPPPAARLTVITPPLVLAALRSGYLPLWHPSAAEVGKA
jgi:hypothetical protein